MLSKLVTDWKNLVCEEWPLYIFQVLLSTPRQEYNIETTSLSMILDPVSWIGNPLPTCRSEKQGVSPAWKITGLPSIHFESTV